MAVLTDLSPMSMCQGATNPRGVSLLTLAREGARLFHLNKTALRLHRAARLPSLIVTRSAFSVRRQTRRLRRFRLELHQVRPNAIHDRIEPGRVGDRQFAEH